MRALPAREEEAELIAHYGVLPEDEFYDLPFEIRVKCYLVNTRRFMSLLGYWRDCRLPRCRRAKACLGELRPQDKVDICDSARPAPITTTSVTTSCSTGRSIMRSTCGRHALIGGSRLRDAENEENGA
ncbi:hypothetical protein [Rhizobium sullae]|uniref:Uncharacterized protein n=1 Tax=Rhizobium sullae TaxID=50338 RepID=A0A4R3Q9G2_RHISU|nr:hypothetical protein [Rhizobium sullae]TCU17921.1 hypothetical protein EV132_10337 [Rhizobium sullae]